MKEKIEMIDLIEEYPKYKEALFCRGYFITSSKIIDLKAYPFYNNWNKANFGKLIDNSEVRVYYHRLQDYCSVEENGIIISIIGHAYNPFNMKYREEDILRECLKEYQKSRDNFFDKINELTGIYLILLNDHGRLIVVQDCCGMRSCYFGKIDKEIIVTSHPQLVGDLYNLQRDPFVTRLTNSQCYNIGNRYLPGNISPYKELKRLGGNTFISYDIEFNLDRFYPFEPIEIIKTEAQYSDGIKEIVDIMHNTLELATKKWIRPAISLSGGMDSKTTLACANGLYDIFSYFSFYCKPQEKVDAEAAGIICDKIGLKHVVYEVTLNNDNVENYKILKRIIDHNTSYILNIADHEIRKMIYFFKKNDFDVELKSWASETARVFLERKYGVKMPEVLNERHFSIFQTRFFMTPELLKETDKLNKKFMEEICLVKPIYNFEHTDLFYWEVRMGAWGAAVFSSLDLCHNVTIPMNNRKLLEHFLSFSREKRKQDIVHKAVVLLANQKFDHLEVEIRNLYFHNYRIWLEKLYYYYRTLCYRSRV